MAKLSEIVFRSGKLGSIVESRASIQLFEGSSYRLSMLWYYVNTSSDKYTIPNYVFNSDEKIDEDLFIEFIEVTIGSKYFNLMSTKKINDIMRIMYILDYKDKESIWSKITPNEYSYDLVLTVKKYDPIKAAVITNAIDWSVRAKRKFFEKFKKEELLEIVLEMSKSKKRRFS